MVKVRDIRDFYDSIAPFYMKYDFDNIGILVGFPENAVKKVLVALDITDDVIEEAINYGAELIVSHHPLIFEPLKRITFDDIKGRKIIKMIQNGISAICLHTNMDSASGGVNDALMSALGVKNPEILCPHGNHPDGAPYGISRIGCLEKAYELNDYLSLIKTNLSANGLRYVSGGKNVYKIACCGGAGAGDMFKAVEMGCDTYVTSDLKYDHFLTAKEMGLNLIDADHFCTENVIVTVLRDKLLEKWPDLNVQISKVHKQTIQFI
ncbi:MAG: Nif3-like dinuclear metal center hexameric protein [Ruminococcaceae bacterium]|nr:Nif3-like dinuclear metal center hexameric protein [Oscillospiraceae bacterium]